MISALGCNLLKRLAQKPFWKRYTSDYFDAFEITSIMSGKVDLTTFVTGIMHHVCALDRTGYIGFHRESTSKAKSLIQKKFQKASHAPALHTPSSAPDYNRRHVRWLKPQIFRVLDIFYCKEKKREENISRDLIGAICSVEV